MRDERYWPVLGTWLKDTAVTPPDPRQTAYRVAERLPETQQVRRFWWLPSRRRAPRTLDRHGAMPPQAGPIPATIGHTPTVIGRTQPMLSPAQAIIAGALVFGIGGAMLIAQPFGQQATVPGAATDVEAAAPVEFTGSIAFGPCTGTPAYESSDVRTRTLNADNGRFCVPGVIEPFSDPRLQGDYYVWNNYDSYVDGPEIWATAFSIVTADGAWRGIPDVFLGDAASGQQILIGEGAYEGLTAIAAATLDGSVWDWHGWIIADDLPPLPEEPADIP
jgi:hypothetical protein